MIISRPVQYLANPWDASPSACTRLRRSLIVSHLRSGSGGFSLLFVLQFSLTSLPLEHKYVLLAARISPFPIINHPVLLFVSLALGTFLIFALRNAMQPHASTPAVAQHLHLTPCIEWAVQWFYISLLMFYHGQSLMIAGCINVAIQSIPRPCRANACIEHCVLHGSNRV